MSYTASGKYRVQKWYSRNIFPLVPLLEIKEGNKHNTGGFTFRWLFFTFWSLDTFQFEISLVCSGHWGLGFIGILPYFRWVISIPCPEKVSIWFNRKLSRNTER